MQSEPGPRQGPRPQRSGPVSKKVLYGIIAGGVALVIALGVFLFPYTPLSHPCVGSWKISERATFAGRYFPMTRWGPGKDLIRLEFLPDGTGTWSDGGGKYDFNEGLKTFTWTSSGRTCTATLSDDSASAEFERKGKDLVVRKGLFGEVVMKFRRTS